MYPASEAIKIDLLGRREAKEGATFVREPNFVARNIPHPHPEFGSACGELHALSCFAQINLACLQPPSELRSMEQVVAQFVSHRRDNSRIRETEKKRNVDDSPDHKRHMPSQNRTKNHAATDNKSASPVAPPPHGDRSIDEKDKH